MRRKKKILVAMSGGIDSSLAAALAEPSFATRKNASNDRNGGNRRMTVSRDLSRCNIAGQEFADA